MRNANLLPRQRELEGAKELARCSQETLVARTSRVPGKQYRKWCFTAPREQYGSRSTNIAARHTVWLPVILPTHHPREGIRHCQLALRTRTLISRKQIFLVEQKPPPSHSHSFFTWRPPRNLYYRYIIIFISLCTFPDEIKVSSFFIFEGAG